MNGWNNCCQGQMPEDIYPKESIRIIEHNKTEWLGPFLCVNTFKNTENYFVCSRFRRPNGRWQWGGMHPLAWREIPKFSEHSTNITY